MRGLDPRICRLLALSTYVIPAKAEIQLHLASAQSWTPTFVGVTNE